MPTSEVPEPVIRYVTSDSVMSGNEGVKVADGIKVVKQLILR